MATATDTSLKVVTGEVRLSYVHLFEPHSNDPDKDAKYSTVILVPKTDKKTIKAIKAAQLEALEQGKGKFGGKVPANWKNTFHDGDEDADLDMNPEYEGHMFMTISANKAYPPGIIDRARREILDASEVYSGCYARVSMVAFAFNTSGNKGVSFGLRHVQKLRDGEYLGGGRSKAEDDFDELDDEDDDDLI